MAKRHQGAGRVQRFLNRVYARMAARGPISEGFVSEPEPRTIGQTQRGRQLIAGQFRFGGHLVEDPDADIWDIGAPDGYFDDDRHGFVWLDDLAAIGNLPSKQLARNWTRGWIDRYRKGAGPGWRPGLTGRRVSRWISHGVMITDGADDELRAAFIRSLSQQTHFLARRHARSTRRLPRFEALGGLIHASLALRGMQGYLEPAMKGMAAACRTEIASDGSIDSRSPEELLNIFAILAWTGSALSDAGRIVPRDQLAAIERIAPVLRALRHGDGKLARFQGGGRGAEGRLDHALAASGQRNPLNGQLAMGFARLSGGRTSVIVDATAPAKGRASANAHASTLAFELTSARRPLIVSCGSGSEFGAQWHHRGRSTDCHSTLALNDEWSSRLGRSLRTNDRQVELMVDVPGKVTASFEADDNETSLSLSHDGYVRTNGLTHSRHLRLLTDGRSLWGEDELAALTRSHKRRFDVSRVAEDGGAFRYYIRFHLHPDVDSTLTSDGVRMLLKSGEVWQFEARGPVTMALEDGIFLEKGFLEPRTTKQIILSGTLLDYSTRVTWSLAKSDETPQGVRDFGWGTEGAKTD